jgi:hypothetical protein
MTTQRYMHLSPAALDAAIRLLEHSAGPPKGGRSVLPIDGGIQKAAGTGRYTPVFAGVELVEAAGVEFEIRAIDNF